jgi:hypothetical protein
VSAGPDRIPRRARKPLSALSRPKGAQPGVSAGKPARNRCAGFWRSR